MNENIIPKINEIRITNNSDYKFSYLIYQMLDYLKQFKTILVEQTKFCKKQLKQKYGMACEEQYFVNFDFLNFTNFIKQDGYLLN